VYVARMGEITNAYTIFVAKATVFVRLRTDSLLNTAKSVRCDVPQ
jgi:hypothetical protein